MIIRTEQLGDEAAIYELTAKAFEHVEYSDGSEPDIIDKLRSDGDLVLFLVAVKDNAIVGHIAFSAVRLGNENMDWFGLGPISVAPHQQRTGIGSALINEGLSRLKSNHAKGCVLVGDPNYYVRFGYKSDGRVTYGEVPNEYVQWLSLDGTLPIGEIKYRPAFGG